MKKNECRKSRASVPLKEQHYIYYILFFIVAGMFTLYCKYITYVFACTHAILKSRFNETMLHIYKHKSIDLTV
jgi:hypothetical protein